MDLPNILPKPTFALTRGEEFEAVCNKIEDKFKASLQKIENEQDLIFDVNSTNWNKHILQ